MTNDLSSASLQPGATPYNDDYDICDRTVAELRIYGDELDPELLSQRLGISSSTAQHKGQVFTNSLGRSRTAKVGGWFLSSENSVNSRELRRHLDWLIAQLRDVTHELIALQNESDTRMNITVIWWSNSGDGGFTLEPQHMRAMAEMNVECRFELAFYGPEDDPSLTEPNNAVKDTGP
jgi:Domain of unknown function (DUF4279)